MAAVGPAGRLPLICAWGGELIVRQSEQGVCWDCVEREGRGGWGGRGRRSESEPAGGEAQHGGQLGEVQSEGGAGHRRRLHRGHPREDAIGDSHLLHAGNLSVIFASNTCMQLKMCREAVHDILNHPPVVFPAPAQGTLCIHRSLFASCCANHQNDVRYGDRRTTLCFLSVCKTHVWPGG